MKFNDKARPLYLEIRASGVGLGAGLLKGKIGMNCPLDKVPENTILRTTAFFQQKFTNC